MRKSFKYRLYPTQRQAAFLDGQAAEACRLYNAAVQERRDAYRLAGKSLNYYAQANNSFTGRGRVMLNYASLDGHASVQWMFDVIL